MYYMYDCVCVCRNREMSANVVHACCICTLSRYAHMICDICTKSIYFQTVYGACKRHNRVYIQSVYSCVLSSLF